MPSQGFRDWLAAGKPYALIRPARALQRNLKRHGLTVYDYPDDDHLEANTPEDHTPFSVTGWPSANARWKARGLDVMPRNDSRAARKENADIARQLIRDRDAGVPGVAWIKYINWTDESGTCRQERWMPAHTTRSSTDKGHIHVSGRSDADDDPRAEDYDPIARMDGDRGMSVHSDSILEAWRLGAPKAADGSEIEPVKWRIRDEAWQRSITAALAGAAADAKSARIAIEALVAAINAGGGSVDAAAIIAHVDALAAAERDRELQLLAEVAELRAELAAARAVAEAQLSPAERAALPPH
ncbi:hypothetical protein ABZS66_51390 [Dactylosporangium sp. NPDC005572]|uniref:hypothetical protein n=1 Tax=Dactylosporangium sp. NPDC005572 TaxID=3156889 RepID=UPI0033A18AE6